MKRILIISDTETHPTNKGNSYAILSQVQLLKKLGCEVHLLFYQIIQRGQEEESKKILELMQGYWGNHLHYFKVSTKERIFMNIKTRYNFKYKKGKFKLYDHYPNKLNKEVIALQKEYNFDICIVNYIFLTKIFDYVDFHVKACFTHDTFAYKNLKVNENTLWVDANSEALALQKCTHVLAIQEEEMHYFKVLSPLSIHQTVFTPYTYKETPIVGNQAILFFSGPNIYNINGLNWYIKNVHPLVIKTFPESKLIIGGGICKVIKNTYSDIKGIVLEGYVEDPISFFKKGDIAINPTYQGTGLKIKTFESMANDKVTIVHPHSINGIFQKNIAPLFSSAEPNDWFNYIKSIWTSPNKIADIKKQNNEYMIKYNKYIESEYKKLINA